MLGGASVLATGIGLVATPAHAQHLRSSREARRSAPRRRGSAGAIWLGRPLEEIDLLGRKSEGGVVFDRRKKRWSELTRNQQRVILAGERVDARRR